jgi:hypothetical protein
MNTITTRCDGLVIYMGLTFWGNRDGVLRRQLVAIVGVSFTETTISIAAGNSLESRASYASYQS